MKQPIRIPTLLGLAILFGGLVAGVMLVNQQQVRLLKASPSQQSKDVQLVNITANSASVSWQTDTALPGFVQYGTTPSLGKTAPDERDTATPEAHTLHLVNLAPLTPATTYYLQITSGSTTYPTTEPISFTTPAEDTLQNYQPLIGSVLDHNRQPVPEALVRFNLEGAQPLASITKIAGNFILPLAYLKTTTLDQPFTLAAGQAGTLVIVTPDQSYTVTLPLPYTEQTLPPIILGQTTAITLPTASPAAAASPRVSTSSFPSAKHYDLNNDGVVNSLDLGIVIENRGKTPKIKAADLNGDGVVDKQDIDQMHQYLAKRSP